MIIESNAALYSCLYICDPLSTTILETSLTLSSLLRLVKEDNGFQYTLEIKNDYSYDGATTSNIECRYIVTSNHDYITTYSGTFVASTNNDVVYSITTSPNYMVGTISNALKDSEGNIIKDTYLPLSGLLR